MKDFFFGLAGTVFGFTGGRFGGVDDDFFRVRFADCFFATLPLDPGLILSSPGVRTSANRSLDGLRRPYRLVKNFLAIGAAVLPPLTPPS